jgi:integrase
VDDARKTAEAYNADIAAGRDPRASRRNAKRDEPTFGQLFQEWREKHGRNLRSFREWERIYTAYLSSWASKRLGAIKKGDVAGLHLRLGDEHGHVQGNRALSLVKMMFSKADGLGWAGPSPAAGVKKFPETSRDRYLQAEELPRFFQALTEEPNPHLQGFFVLCLATAARRGTIQRMKWSDLDLGCPSGPYWRCPETKAGKPQLISLIPIAVEVLNKLRPLCDGGEYEYVFPAVRRGKNGSPYLKDPMPAWRRLCKRAGLEGLTIHDLRRSSGSWAAISGVSLGTIAGFLGHSPNSQMTQIYARLSQDAKRSALTTAMNAMTQLGGEVRLLPQVELPQQPAPVIDVHVTTAADGDDEPTEF